MCFRHVIDWGAHGGRHPWGTGSRARHAPPFHGTTRPDTGVTRAPITSRDLLAQRVKAYTSETAEITEIAERPGLQR